jgi:hypothetical protein
MGAREQVGAMTPRHPKILLGLALFAGSTACGSGRLDPFDELRYQPPSPTEDCSAVDTDSSQSFIPEALATVTTTLQATTAGDFRIEWAPYPLPYGNAKVWALWGKGALAQNGRYYSAVGDGGSAGDESGHEGNTFLYEYDPETALVRAVGDVQSAFGMHVAGENGYGKIQAHIAEGPCGLLYLHTYWGSPSAVVYGGNYQGDLLLRYNPWTAKLASLGVKIPHMGVPSLSSFRAGGLLYAEANTPTDPKEAVFWAYDVERDSVVFQSPRRQRNDRHIAVDGDGNAYYAGPGSELYRYDPRRNSEAKLSEFPGGGWLRTSTRQAADGSFVLVTTEPDEAYRFTPGAPSLTLLASLPRAIADIELDPSERVAYFLPVGLDLGTGLELYELSRQDGTLRTLLDIGAAIEDAGGSRPRGSHSLVLSPDGKTLFIGANSGEPDGYGIPELIIVHLPDSALP